MMINHQAKSLLEFYTISKSRITGQWLIVIMFRMSLDSKQPWSGFQWP